MRPDSLRRMGFLSAWILTLLSATLACSFVTNRLQAIQKQVSPVSGLIVYVGTDGNIYTIDQNGKQQTRVTQEAASATQSYQFPTWSPDSQRISYLGIHTDSSNHSAVVVYTAAPDGKDQVEVYTGGEEIPFYFFWSPDSQSLSFLAPTSGNDSLNLHLVPARGGQEKVLGMGSPFYWDWSPDSQRIILHIGGDASSNPEARLAFLTLASQDERRLDLHPGLFQAPAWSPDGAELLLSTQNEGGQDSLMLLKADGTVEKTVDTSSGPQAFGWSPDGENIAYLAPKAESSQAFFRTLKLFVRQSGQNRVIDPDEEVIAFFWSPDSQKIAYFVPALIPQPTGPQGVSQTKPTIALRLVLYDVRSGSSRQFAPFTPTDQLLSVIPFFDQYQHSATIWSPDSQHLVVAAVDQSGKAGIYVVNAAGSQEQSRIAAGDLAFWSWK